MLGFVAPRLVLLSVPKTGTTALEEALVPHAQVILRARPEIKHMTLAQYQRSIAPLLRTIPGQPFRTVALVREPMSWLGSWYRYRQRPQLRGKPNSTAGIDFEGFVAAYLSDGKRPPFARIGRQSGFLRPEPGQPAIDLTFRFEQIDRLVDFLSAQLGAKIVLDRRNVSPSGDLTLSAQTRARLREALADDYALWDAAGDP